MIDVPIFWAEYTATIQGQTLKLVPCENCSTEYVYVLDREGFGAGASLYLLDNAGAAARAQSGADESLKAYLENDFDPVPCPSCGHYQRFMFPKLYTTTSHWTVLVRFAVLLFGLLAAVGTAYWAVECLMQPNDHALGRLALTVSLLVLLGLAGAGLVAMERANARRFDPNTVDDQQARLAKGRKRAKTRAEFEAAQKRAGGGVW